MSLPPRVQTGAVLAAPAPAAGAALRARSIEARGLVKWYGPIIALNDVTITISPGVTGLLGPNGAGKSTLLKLITGQLRPSKGVVGIDGEDVWGNAALYARIGLAPEQDSFYEWMTGLEFVSSLLRLNGFTPDRALDAATEALERVGLTDARDRRVRGYSKGMRQRVKLAQAIAHDPDIILLDEPLSGLDPLGRSLFIKLIRSWGAEGRIVVVSSHILHEVESMTENIVLIHRGRMLAEGGIHQIRALIDTHPHHVLVQCSEPRKLAAMLITEDDVLDVRFEPDGRGVVFQTHRPDAFYMRLPPVVRDSGIDVEEVSSPDDNLEAVFRYLVGPGGT